MAHARGRVIPARTRERGVGTQALYSTKRRFIEQFSTLVVHVYRNFRRRAPNVCRKTQNLTIVL
jgi:hypothetical protein